MISLRGPKLRIFAGALALICFIAGVYLTFFQSRGFVKTEAVITGIEEVVDEASGETTDIVTVEYTVDGQTYSGVLDQTGPSYKVGKTVNILYDPDDPSVIHGGKGVSIYVMLMGLAVLLICIFSSIKEKQSQKQVKDLREQAGDTGYAASVKGNERELYFLTDLGTPKYGHRIEDKDRRVLYEAKMTKFTMTQPFGFDFIDHEHGKTVPHLVGHTEESEWDTLLIDNHYTFELDGVDVFKHLKQNGITVDSGLGGGSGKFIGANYRIMRNGEEIAKVESTSQYPHEEDAELHKVVRAIPAPGFYRIWTREKYLDLLFVAMLAFARSGAIDDKGGTYGAILGTLKGPAQ